MSIVSNVISDNTAIIRRFNLSAEIAGYVYQ